MKYLYLSLLLLLLSSCSKPSSNQPLTDNRPKFQFDITWQNLRWFITEDNHFNADFDLFSDQYYTIVDEAFFTNNILNQFDAFLVKNQINLTVTNKNDCDKFTRAFSFFSRTFSIQCTNIQYIIPVADFYYSVGLDKKHAINLIVVLDNITNQKKLIFVEPQTKSIINISLDADFTNPMLIPNFIGM